MSAKQRFTKRTDNGTTWAESGRELETVGMELHVPDMVEQDNKQASAKGRLGHGGRHRQSNLCCSCTFVVVFFSVFQICLGLSYMALMDECTWNDIPACVGCNTVGGGWYLLFDQRRGSIERRHSVECMCILDSTGGWTTLMNSWENGWYFFDCSSSW